MSHSNLIKLAGIKDIKRRMAKAQQQAAKVTARSPAAPAAPLSYSQMNPKQLWDATKNLGSEQLGALSLKDKVRALAGQAQSANWTPKGVGKAMWRNLGEAGGGGGWSGGSGTLARHLPAGAKLTVASMALPTLASSFSKEDAEGKGRSRLERFGEGVGQLAGSMGGYLPHSVNRYLGMAAVPVSFGASMLAGSLGQKAGGFIGRQIDKGYSKLTGQQTGDVMMQKFQQQRQLAQQPQPPQQPQQPPQAAQPLSSGAV